MMFVKKHLLQLIYQIFLLVNWLRSTSPSHPLHEQHQIVSRIETLFSELDNGIENLKKARQQLKVYRQAVLKYAFDGKLTEKWRASSDATPVRTGFKPVPTPTKNQPVPTKNQPVPINDKPVPTDNQPVPTKTETDPAPTKTETDPVPPVRTGFKPVPTTDLLEKIKTERKKQYKTQLKEWEKNCKKAVKEGKKKPVKLKEPKDLPSLTEDELAELPELPEGWGYIKLGEMIDEPKYGTSKKCKYENKGNPVLRIPNIGNGFIIHDDLKYAEFDDEEKITYKLKVNDLLIIR